MSCLFSHLCIGVVGVPGGPEGLLSSYIPHQEVSVLHHYLLHIAPDGGWRVHDLIHQTFEGKNQLVFSGKGKLTKKGSNCTFFKQNDLQLVEDGGFSCVIQSNNYNLVLCKKKYSIP